MSTTPNLLIPHILAAQNNKEVTANTGFDDFDGAITDLLAVTMTTADYVLSTGAGNEALGHLCYKLTGTIGSARNLIVPVNKKLYVVSNQTTGGFAVTVKTSGGSGIALSDTNYHILYCDGTNVVQLAAVATSVSLAFTGLSDVPGSYSGAGSELVAVNSGATALEFVKRRYKPAAFVGGTYSNSQVIINVPLDETVSFVANFAGSRATLADAATGSTVFIINKVIAGTPTQIGTITFSGAGTVGTFASSSGAAQSINAGDVLQVQGPSSADATAGGLGFVLSGTY